MSEITAWYDQEKKAQVIQDNMEVFYYMIHASSPLERLHWAHEYIEQINSQQPSRLKDGND